MAQKKKSKKNTAKQAPLTPVKKKTSRPSAAKKRATASQAPRALEGLTAPGKIAWWTLTVLIFLVPLALSNLKFLGAATPLGADVYDTIKVSILRVGSFVALIAWAYDILVYGGKVRVHKIYAAVVAFLVWAGISTMLSVSPVTSFFGKYRRYEGMWSYLIYAVLFFLVVQYATNGSRMRMLAKTLVFSSVVVAFYGLLQAAGIEPIMTETTTFEAGRSFSTYGNPDLLAGFLAFGVFVSMGLAFGERRTGWRIFYWIALVMNSAVVVTASSRSIWVGSAVAGVFFIILLVWQRSKPQKVDGVFLGGAAAATIGLAVKSLSAASDVTNFASRVGSIFDFKNGSALTRFEIWQAALHAIKDRPIFGFGPDTFRLVFRRYAPVAYAKDAGYRSVADNVHNYVLQLGACVGIVGMLLFYVWIGWAAVIAGRFAFTRKEDETADARSNRIVYGGILTACIGYLVHLLFGLSLPGATFLLFIFLGVLLAPAAREIEVAPRPTFVSLPLVGALCVLGVVVTVFTGRFLAADYHAVLGDIKEAAATDTAGLITQRKAAYELNPFNDMYYEQYFQALTNYALGGINAIQSGTATLAQVKPYIEQADSVGRSLIAFMPWEFDNYALLASYYNSVGQGTGDASYYRKAIALEEPQIAKTPTGLALRFVHAQTLIQQGKMQQAIAELKVCTAQDPNFTDAQTTLSALTK